MLMRQAFQVVELPRIVGDIPPSPTFPTVTSDSRSLTDLATPFDPFGLHEIKAARMDPERAAREVRELNDAGVLSREEARKLAEKIMPGIPTLTHEEAASEFTRLVAFPEEEARFSSEHKRKAIKEMAGVTAPETPPTLLRSKTGAEPTYTPESRVGTLKYPDGTVVTFMGNTGHFACSCPKFRKDGGCCEHIKNCIVKGDDAQFVPYAYGEKIPLVLALQLHRLPHRSHGYFLT